MPIGVLRQATCDVQSNFTQCLELPKIIAQPCASHASLCSGIVQYISARKFDIDKRTSASRGWAPLRAQTENSRRDAVRALTTGWVALALEEPSQGRRSLSRIPASDPQGFLPVEFNLI
jgi:hypothetical protein